MVAGTFTLVAVVLWAISLPRVDASRVNGLGLISVIGPTFLVAVGCLNTAFVITVSSGRSRVLTAIQVACLVVMLYTVASIVEPEPAYFTAYLHAGFANYIASHGTTLPLLDARFNWPGSFALAAMVTRTTGIGDAVYLIRWAPLFFEVLSFAPLWVIVSSATPVAAARWSAVWLFYLSNWVAQDFLSPQAVNFFLYLVVMATLLHWLRRSAGEPRPGRLGQVRGWLAGDGGGEEVAGRRLQLSNFQRRAALVCVVVIAASITVSHQATPIFLILSLAALVLSRRLSARRLPLLVGIMFLAYLSFGAEDFWRGHMNLLVGGLGRVGSNVSANVGNRIKGSSLHRYIIYLRIALPLSVLALATFGFLRARARGRRSGLWVVLALAPWALVAFQSYGGEAVLRAYLFSLPFLCVLAVGGFPAAVESPGRSPKIAAGAAALALLSILSVGFIGARYGNEQFEQVPSSELHAVQWVYAHAQRGSMMIAASRNLPWRYQQLDTYTYVPPDDAILSSSVTVISYMKTRSQAPFFISTNSQQVFGEELYGLPPKWLDRLDRRLEQSGQVKVVFREGDARVYTLYGSMSELP